MRTKTAVCLLLLLVIIDQGQALCAVTADGNADTRKAFRSQLEKQNDKINLGIAYWIELFRDGKKFHCNNKFVFHSGDAIRIHIIPNADGYAYILLKSGSRGDKDILFPNAQSGNDNFVVHGKDYGLPTVAKLKFDNDPGEEKLSLIFSRKQIDIKEYMNHDDNQTVVVGSPGSKDLVPTRMQLCWDDPTPVIMPDDMSTAGSNKQAGDVGMVTVISQKPNNILAVDVALEHQ